jgi:hypothetical protein
VYDMTDSSWVSIRFVSSVQVYFTDDTSGRNYMSSQMFQFFLCIGAHALGFVG